MGVAVHPQGLHQPVALLHQPVTQAPLLHPATAFSTAAAVVTQATIASRSAHGMIDPQYTLARGNGQHHHVVPTHIIPSGVGMCQQHHTYNPATIHHQAINLVTIIYLLFFRNYI